MNGGCYRLAWQGRLEEARSTSGQSRSPAGGVVDLQVIGMAVAAAWVVADQHVHALVVEDVGDPTGHLVDVGMREAAPMLAMEPGIGVAQLLESMDAQDVGGLGEFGLPHQTEVRKVLVRGEAGLAIGGDDEDDPKALCGRPGHRARGEQRLVVWMGVDEGDDSTASAGLDRHLGMSHISIVLHDSAP